MDGIPVQDFDKMFHEARAAFEVSDIGTVLAINEGFNQVGYTLLVRNGGLFLQNTTTPQIASPVNTAGTVRGNYSR